MLAKTTVGRTDPHPDSTITIPNASPFDFGTITYNRMRNVVSIFYSLSLTGSATQFIEILLTLLLQSYVAATRAENCVTITIKKSSRSC